MRPWAPSCPGSSLASANHDEVGEQGFQLDPLVASLDDAELDLTGLVHHADLLRIGDTEVEDGLVDLTDTRLEQRKDKPFTRQELALLFAALLPTSAAGMALLHKKKKHIGGNL